jgi:hypothetical protein
VRINHRFPQGVALFWEHDQDTGRLTVALRAPLGYLRPGFTPSITMEQFMRALANRGVDISDLSEVRVRINSNDNTFIAKWVGVTGSGVKQISTKIGELSKSMGITQHKGSV